jgi:hypothetical protein
MPTYLFILLYFYTPSIVGGNTLELNSKLFLLGFIFVYTFVFPAIAVFWFYKRGLIESIRMETLDDRKFPFFLTASIYAILGYFMYSRNVVLLPSSFIVWAIALVIFLVAVISLRWQISAHAAGMGGLVGIVAAIMFQTNEDRLFTPLLGLLMLSGYLIAARLQLNAHTLRQVGAGFVLGILAAGGVVFYFF